MLFLGAISIEIFKKRVHPVAVPVLKPIQADIMNVFSDSPSLLIVEVMRALRGDLHALSRPMYVNLHRKIKYHMDKLVDLGYLIRENDRYRITEKGYEYLKASGLPVPDIWENPFVIPLILSLISFPLFVLGSIGWKVVYYTANPSGAPPLIQHTVNVSSWFLSAAFFLIGLAIGCFISPRGRRFL